MRTLSRLITALLITTTALASNAQSTPDSNPNESPDQSQGQSADQRSNPFTFADKPQIPSPIQRPFGSGRLVGKWDFEDAITPDGIIVPFPIGWVSGNPAPPLETRDGFPAWNEPGFSNTQARSGNYAFALPTQGGSVSARLTSGLLPALPGAQYLITAHVKTNGAAHAKARIKARYATTVVVESQRLDSIPDEFQQPPQPATFEQIQSSEVASNLISSEGTWSELQIVLPPSRQAQFIELEIEFLQPDQQPNQSQESSHELSLEDVNATAYFDDIQIFQVPTTTFNPTEPLGLFQRSTKPGITVTVRDLTGEPLRAELTAFDAEANIIDTLNISSSRLTQPFTWSPSLERYGWYRLTLELYNDNQRISSDALDIVWLGSEAKAEPSDTSFGITLVDPDEQTLASIPNLAKSLGISAVSMPAWGAIDRHPNGPEIFANTVDQLLDRGVSLTLGLDRIPAPLARERRLDPDRILTLLAQPDPTWVDDIEPVLTRFGERVVRWRVSAPGDTQAALLENPAALLSGLHDTLSFLIPRGELALPWPATIDPPALSVTPGSLTDTVDGFVISLPTNASPEMIDIASNRNPVAGRSSLHLQLDNEPRFNRADRARQIAALLAHAWASNFMTTELSAPIDTRRNRVQPRADAGVLTTFANRVGPATYTGKLNLGQGITAMIGRAPDASGILIAWKTQHSINQATNITDLVAPRGTPIAYDPFGNETPLQPSERGGFQLDITETPTIVTGLNFPMLMFRAAARFEPETIAARAMRNDAEFIIENTWGTTLSGTIRFEHPDSWRVQPEVIPVLLAAGEQLRVPVSMTFGLNELAGLAPIRLKADLQARDAIPEFEVPLRLDVGLDPLIVRSTFQPAGNAPRDQDDLIVYIVVENRSQTDTISVETYLRVPSYPTMQAPLNIPPGETMQASFTLTKGIEKAWGKQIRFGVIEQEGTARLNMQRTIE